MPASLESILQSAHKEWKFWGKSTWHVPAGHTHIGATDDQAVFAQHVVDAYCSVGGGSPTLFDIQDDRYYWSAVGMSAIMKGAGFLKSEFPFAQSHSVFIRHFIKARKQQWQDAAFWGFRAGEAGAQPEVGDVVAYARAKKMTAEKAAALYDSTSSYESHTDVVVARRDNEIDVIGANVLDSVTMKTLSLNGQGHIEDNRHFWFAVLKRRPA